MQEFRGRKNSNFIRIKKFIQHIEDDELVDYCLDALDREAKIYAKKHLADCDECKKRFEEVRQSWLDWEQEVPRALSYSNAKEYKFMTKEEDLIPLTVLEDIDKRRSAFIIGIDNTITIDLKGILASSQRVGLDLLAILPSSKNPIKMADNSLEAVEFKYDSLSRIIEHELFTAELFHTKGLEQNLICEVRIKGENPSICKVQVILELEGNIQRKGENDLVEGLARINFGNINRNQIEKVKFELK